MFVLRVCITLCLCILVSGFAASVAYDDRFGRGGPGNGKRSMHQRGERPRISLAQAVETTLARNPVIGEAFSRIRQLRWKSRAVYSDFFPSISVNYTGTWPKYMVGATNLGPPDHESRYSQYVGRIRLGLPKMDYPYRIDPYRRFSANVTITQPLYQGGRVVSDYRSARLGVTDSVLQLRVDRQDLILEVYRAYYSIMLAKKILEVVNESISTLTELKEINEKFLRAEIVTKTDLLSTKGQLTQAHVERRIAQTELDTYKVMLNTLMSFPPETPLEIEDNYTYRPTPYRVPQIYNTAMSNRYEIAQATLSIRQADESRKSAQSSLLPSVSVQAQGTRVNDDWNVLDREASNSWQLMGILTWTFDMFRSTSTVKQRTDFVREQVLARQRLVQDILEQVKTAYLQMKRAEGDISDYRHNVSLRTENFRLFQKRYQEADVSYTEVLIAQRELVLAKADYYRSLIGYRVNLAILERAMGVLRR